MVVRLLAPAGLSSGCGQGGRLQRVPVGDEIGLPHYGNLIEPTETYLESMIRGSFEGPHMEPADIDCVVSKVKTSPWWQTDRPELSIPDERVTEFAHECGVVSELYVLASD